jgi:Flp pilus assembly protein TadG
MRRLIFHTTHEEGAIAVIVAVLFGFGVMIGVGALTVDVGNINADRRQLQNGADAAVLSAAQDCVTSVCPDPSPTTGTAAQQAQAQANYARLGTLANSNAADGATKLARVDGGQAFCGTAPGLKPCSAGTSTTSLQECPDSPFPSTLPYARVYTQTLDTSGHTILPYSFGAAIAGAGSGANQQACASAAWGPASHVPDVFPLTFSYCDWQASKGFNAAPPVGAFPGYGSTAPNVPWPAAGTEVVLKDKGAGVPDCTSWNGHVAPGSFGTLDNSSCIVSDGGNNWFLGGPGNSTPCDATDLHAKIGTIVYIPIYDCFTHENGSFANCSDGKNHDYFHMTGYAPFYLTGFYFSNTKKADGGSIFPPDGGPSGSLPCGGGDRCISGWFTTDTLPTTIDTTGGPSFGSIAIQLAG